MPKHPKFLRKVRKYTHQGTKIAKKETKMISYISDPHSSQNKKKHEQNREIDNKLTLLSTLERHEWRQNGLQYELSHDVNEN